MNPYERATRPGCRGNAILSIWLGRASSLYFLQARPFACARPRAQVSLSLRQTRLEILQITHSFGDEAMPIDHKYLATGLVVAESLFGHLKDKQSAIAPCRTGPHKGASCSLKGVLESSAGGQQGQADCCGSLNIIVEATEPLSITVQYWHCVGLSKILKLN